MAHNSQVTAFNAPLRDAMGPFIPFITTPPISTKGAILGPHLIGPALPFCWDTQGFIRDEYTTRPTVRIYGDVGGGKSYLAKVIGYEFGSVYNAGLRTRLYADNHRRLDGIDEYERLGRLFGGKTLELSEKINLFDPDLGLSMSDHLETAVAIYEASNENAAPQAQTKLALRVGLHEMFTPESMREERPSAERYAHILLEMRKEHATDHIKRVIQRTRQEDNPEAPNPRSEEQLMSVDLTENEYDTGNIDWDEFSREAGRAAQAVIDFLDGEYGETFGGNGSLANRLGGGFAGINFSHKNDQTIAFLVGFVIRIKRTAEINRDRRFLYGIEIMDENTPLWEIPTFARSTSKRLKHARGEDTTIIQIAHRPQDYATVGDTNSQVRRLAMNSAKDIGIVIYARIADPEIMAEIRESAGLTSTEAAIIQNLGKGQYGIQFPGRHLEFFEITRTPFRKWLGETNAATYNALKRAA